MAKTNHFSIETDFRDYLGKVLVSHDPVQSDLGLIDLDTFLDLGVKTALNIKSDGLSNFFESSRRELELSGSWVFDGSIPEMLRYKELGIKHALRISEFEKEIPWTPEVFWIDCFLSDWYINDASWFEKFPNSEIVLVSPELHKRGSQNVWNYFAKLISDGVPNVSICTDLPQQVLEIIKNEV